MHNKYTEGNMNKTTWVLVKHSSFNKANENKTNCLYRALLYDQYVLLITVFEKKKTTTIVQKCVHPNCSYKWCTHAQTLKVIDPIRVLQAFFLARHCCVAKTFKKVVQHQAPCCICYSSGLHYMPKEWCKAAILRWCFVNDIPAWDNR